MYQTIKTPEDVREFLEKTNSLHDGYIISVQYSHGSYVIARSMKWRITEQKTHEE